MSASPARSPSAQRRAQGRAEARRAILDATEALLVEGGGDNLSMRRLAERCGYTPPTIYHHFGDKQGLLDALLEERFRTLLQTLEAVPESEDPLADLRAISLAFARFGLRHPDHYWLLTRPRDPRLPRPPTAEAARRKLESPMERVAAAGRLRAQPQAARQAMWALLHGLISLRSARPDEPWVPDLTEKAVDAMLRGLVAAPSPGSDLALEGSDR